MFMKKMYSSAIDASNAAMRLTELFIQHQAFLAKAEGNYIQFMEDAKGEAGKNVAKNITEFHKELKAYLESLEY